MHKLFLLWMFTLPLKTTGEERVSEIEILEQRCTNDEINYCIDLAETYEKTGELSNAARYFELSCAKNLARGCQGLASLYDRLLKISETKAKSIYSLELVFYREYQTMVDAYLKLCQLKDPLGCERLGEIYLKGRGGYSSFELAIEYFDKGCSLEYAESCLSIGKVYAMGRGVPENEFLAFDYFKKACALDSALGCSSAGNFYFYGRGVRQDDTEATVYLSKGCSLGDADGCHFLGKIYERNKLSKELQYKALQLYGKSCDLKNPLGCQDYARLKKSF